MQATLPQCATPPARDHSLARWVPALLLPLCILGVAEAGARWWSGREVRWYQRAESILQQRPAGALFVGSSRVAAALDEDAWRQATGDTGINLGRGFSTTQEHYFGLRNLLERYPEQLRGTTILIEAPGGMPDEQTWQSTWVHPESPQTLDAVIEASDLPGVWFAPMTLEEKSRITFGLLFRPSALFTQKDRIGTGILLIGGDFFARKVGGVQPAAGGEDLAGGGGIRTDAESVRRARSVARQAAQANLRTQQPVADWNRTVVRDIVLLAQRSGARAVFFEMPLCSLQTATYDTLVRRRDRENFLEHARQWNTPVLRPAIAFTDDDFPDLWHLRKSRAAAFTTALAGTSAGRVSRSPVSDRSRTGAGSRRD